MYFVFPNKPKIIAQIASPNISSYFPVPLQVGQTIFLSPPQLWQGLPLTLPVPLQTGQRIVFIPWHVLHIDITYYLSNSAKFELKRFVCLLT